ncbi:MAG: type III secretion system export apparatus subunit SctV [Burkholderiaceae bacterium]
MTTLSSARKRGGSSRYSDVALAAGIVAIVGLMVFPMPTFLLDTLIAFNISVSVALLLLTMYIRTPLNLSTFPSLLLFTTLLRLSLNIASSKQILLHANAGHIIETFGTLVVGGNVVVGLVVFVIIAIVQFVVIAKGAERVAEVGARFTLDAMPGKQLSIDADLRNGLIDKDEARLRRSTLEQESQLHGAMDGAMKFVKGDAIAGLIIALVNIVAGFAVGALMHGMTMSESLGRYTILTVGDGMVSQIPSLFVSIAAGILITRVSGQDEGGHLGQEISRQVLAHPIALFITGTILLGFVTVPGFPRIQFTFLGGAALLTGYLLYRKRIDGGVKEDTPMPSMRHEGSTVSPVFVGDIGSATSPITLQISPGLHDAIGVQQFDAALADARRELLQQTGIPFPGLQVEISKALPDTEYRLLVNEVAVAHGRREASRARIGVATRQEGMPPGAIALGSRFWVDWRDSGVTIENGGDVDAPPGESVAFESVLAAHVAATIRGHASQMIGIQEVQRLLARAEAQLPELVKEVQKALPLHRVTEVMRRLAEEGLSIRNLRIILESLINWGPREKDVVQLTEQVRIDLGRAIVTPYRDGDGLLRAFAIHPAAEEKMARSVQQNVRGSFMMLAPDETQRFLDALGGLLAAQPENASAPAIVTTMQVRRYVRRMVESRFPDVAVLSYEEIGGYATIQSQGTLSM